LPRERLSAEQIAKTEVVPLGQSELNLRRAYVCGRTIIGLTRQCLSVY